MNTIFLAQSTVFLALLLATIPSWCQCASSDANDVGRVLSRKRRYLIFPEGSSFQLGKVYYKSFANSPFHTAIPFVQSTIRSYPSSTIRTSLFSASPRRWHGRCRTNLLTWPSCAKCTRTAHCPISDDKTAMTSKIMNSHRALRT